MHYYVNKNGRTVSDTCSYAEAFAIATEIGGEILIDTRTGETESEADKNMKAYFPDALCPDEIIPVREEYIVKQSRNAYKFGVSDTVAKVLSWVLENKYPILASDTDDTCTGFGISADRFIEWVDSTFNFYE